MKYYLYISDAKVDMLFPQVPHEIKKKVATEWKMDLKLLSASRRVEMEAEDNRIARLDAVIDFIREFGDLGSVDNPGEYVADTLVMRWGDYDGSWKEPSPVVYFGGQTDHTIVGLGGSSKHVLGNSGESSAHSHSASPFLIKFLADELELRGTKKLEQAEGHLEWFRKNGESFSPTAAVELATLQMRGPEQNVEFIAKKLAYGPLTFRPNLDNEELNDKRVLLATPLYVALAE